jgi:hypothetical protein
VTARSAPRGGGRATLEEIATSTGQSAQEVVKALAELSAAGVVRLTYGPSRPIRGIRLRGQLEITDGEDRYVVLFTDPPWEPLAGERRRHLDAFLAIPGGKLTLGTAAMICAAVRVGCPEGGKGALSFTSDEIEDYLGLARGTMR